ncbi:Gfo/Idh/MocA family protein [Paenibacillus hamazuiensis]|uniref:Gfo/Idh/MocA family protein n=1 Tax=Paenibacillus hamazuiensis TaxID=2936508 RepID=UPI00200F0AAF|nr:Gfo/Idh/MocA family oxidoreductase [Paenibacillus hamazuiensis]
MNIRLGMIGAGGIAVSRHLPNLTKIEGVELTAVANRRYEKALAVSRQFGFRKIYRAWTEVADDPEVDAVFICTPPYMHAEMTAYCLERGKHVFSQARMAMNLPEALDMLRLDRATGLTTMLCPAPHYMQVENYVLRLLKDGGIGDVRHIVLSHPTAMFADPHKPLHWRQRADLQGINVLDVGIMGEVLQKWFGPVKTVSASGSLWTKERPADADGKTAVYLPDSVTVIGQFEAGMTLTALFTGAVKGGVSSMTIHGSEGTITCFPEQAYVLLGTNGEQTRIDVPADERKEWTVERDFVAAIREGRKGTPSFQDGARYMAFTQAIADSIRTGQRTGVSAP